MTLCTADDIGILLFKHDKRLNEIEDDLGDSPAVRAQRRADLYTTLVATFDAQLNRIQAERAEIESSCRQLIKELAGMSKSLGGENMRQDPFVEEPEMKSMTVTKPLRPSLESIREQHNEMKRNYIERLDYVKELSSVLLDYQTRLGPDFLEVEIPNLDAPLGVPDLSLRFINQSMLAEINRCSEELKRRRRVVSQLCTQIIQLIAEREINITDETEFDRAIVLSRDNPDIIGLSGDILEKLNLKKEAMVAEKVKREAHLESLKGAIMPLWEKLGVNMEDAKTFISSNRGITDKVISAYKNELERLKELKRQNLELFIRESRKTLKELWDALYFSCQEMQSFGAAEAALIVHEDEVARLQQVYTVQRPILDLVEKYYALEKERKELEKSSQDTSRLMGRGNRDPGRLLREEKARKKISRELPKVFEHLASVDV
ncbi:Anaphase spindle elongation protein 1 [Neolecta irregularis DAH-3]|uniref:Anaphase spindle elongation protein 1 n=1 Tax=Neolecta irregularis (strain DAH-3) TaxID=1198029 RepID=A0A1U7LK88_NEOID|nr:Anaphase spindle elongation protein 1 [Neolecta irregularis DAH-3]|eukprot:OLL23067.1 Anaphase spindle elongation protein 1 [Neolecta irregularis DAH-3]